MWYRLSKAQFVATVVLGLTFLGWAHPLFRGYDGNIFPYADYPQSLDWYYFSLVGKIKLAAHAGLLWWLARQAKFENAELILLIYWLMELKEIPEYILFANQMGSLYDITALSLIIFLILLLNEFKEEKGKYV